MVDVVLLDVHMPEMDGITLATHIHERFPALPVYALTANVIGSEEQALHAAGVLDILYKPLDESRMKEMLARHTERTVALVEWQLPAGISVEEVANELRRLFLAVQLPLEREGCAAAVDSAHQLLGCARMFARGSLEGLCLALEMALREGDELLARDAMERVRALLESVL
jgi:response regulator RpfG family c-di-GMP phosphodiesterase